MGEALACFAAQSGRLANADTVTFTVGGAELNTAVGLSRLGDTVTFVSRVGDDAFGEKVRSEIRRNGMDTGHARVIAGAKTGIMFKDRVSAMDVRTTYRRESSAASQMAPGDIDERLLLKHKRVHLTGLNLWIGPGPRALALKLMELATAGGIPVSFDPNFRPALASQDEMRTQAVRAAKLSTDFLCNEEEALAITNERDVRSAASALSALGPRAVVVKLGADGAIAIIDGAFYEQPAWNVDDPVDSVGAGDAFNAGWIHSSLHHALPPEALKLAAFVSANVVRNHHDYDGFPSRVAVDAWLTSEKTRASAGDVHL